MAVVPEASEGPRSSRREAVCLRQVPRAGRNTRRGFFGSSLAALCRALVQECVSCGSSQAQEGSRGDAQGHPRAGEP